jgi:cysteine desulfurase
MIYLDNAATTKTDPAVVACMIPLLSDTYGNPGSIHAAATEPQRIMREARQSVASFLGCHSSDVIFTSGGSEGNSLIISGLLNHLREHGKQRIVVSATEHDSILRAAFSALEQGFDICTLPVNREGCVEPHVLEAAMSPDTGLVSVMYVNNELGGVNDVKALADICHSHDVLFHTDCVQAAGFEKLDMTEIGCDFATISAHKFHGPKGIGAIYAKHKDLLSPIIYGGDTQEFGLRGGTENVPCIAGMGFACDLAMLNLDQEVVAISTIKQSFYTELVSRLRSAGLSDIMSVNGPPVIQPGKILNLRFTGVDSETLVLALSGEGVCISSGSACNSHSVRPSHVLTAIGLSADEARSSVRISFSRYNTELEALAAAQAMARCVSKLSAMR